MKFALYICIISICFTFQAKLKQVLQVNKINLDKLITEAVQYLTFSEENFLTIEGNILSSFSTTSSSSHLPQELECNKKIFQEFKSALFGHQSEIRRQLVPSQPVTTYNPNTEEKICNQRQKLILTDLNEKIDELKESVRKTYSKLPKVKTIFDVISDPTYDMFKTLVKHEKEYFEEVDTKTYFNAFNCENWTKVSPFQSLYYVSSLLVESLFKYFKCPKTHSTILLPKNEISDKSFIQMTPIFLESFVIDNEYFKFMESTALEKLGNGFTLKRDLEEAVKIFDEMIKKGGRHADKYREKMMKQIAYAIGNGMKTLNKIGREVIKKRETLGI